MMLKAIKNIPSRGINEGDTFKTENPEIFLKNGLARHLVKEEVLSILDGYIREAGRVFMLDNIEPGKKEKTQEVLF